MNRTWKKLTALAVAASVAVSCGAVNVFAEEASEEKVTVNVA